MGTKVFSATMLSCLALTGMVVAAPQINDAALELSRTRELLERERVAQQIQADIEKNKQKRVDSSEKSQVEQSDEVKFVLKDILTDPSTVLSEDELKDAKADALGKSITVQELYEVVTKINELYLKKGYITCRAFLTPQTIKGGVAKITLVEGKAGKATIEGNKSTKTKFLSNRLHLDDGKVIDINALNKDLLWFNGTNDVQLRVVMKAGETYGTTDYVLQVYEPKQHNFNLFSDNAGSYSSGAYRGGIFYNNKSLTGNRDNLNIGTLRSKGTKAGILSYSRIVGRSGTKLNFNYSSNSVHQIKNINMAPVRSHAVSYSLAVVQPLLVNDTTRTEIGLEYDRQNSKSNLQEYNLVSDLLHDGGISFAMTNYGKSHVFYQKHGYFRGYVEHTPGVYKASSENYGYYKLNSFYQKAYKNQQSISLRTDAQWSGSTIKASARQFTIGGLYSVRGYKENYLSGDSGFNISAEYVCPISKGRNIDLFTFFDYGKIYGDSAGVDRILASVGMGLKTNINKRYYASVSIGCPLRKEFMNGAEKVSKTRTHFMVNGQF